MQTALDTNIFVYLVDGRSPFHLVTLEAVAHLQRRGVELVFTVQNVIEFWSVVTRPVETKGLSLTTSEAAARVEWIQQSFTLLSEQGEIYPQWKRLVLEYGVRGKQVHDAHIAAALVAAGVSHLITWNAKDFKRFKSLTALTPGEVLAGGLDQ